MADGISSSFFVRHSLCLWLAAITPYYCRSMAKTTTKLFSLSSRSFCFPSLSLCDIFFSLLLFFSFSFCNVFGLVYVNILCVCSHVLTRALVVRESSFFLLLFKFISISLLSCIAAFKVLTSFSNSYIFNTATLPGSLFSLSLVFNTPLFSSDFCLSPPLPCFSYSHCLSLHFL